MKTLVDQIEVRPDGSVQVRFAKPGIDMQHQAGYHRAMVPPGRDPNEVLDHVDRHLVQMGYPVIEDRSMILDACKTFHTPQRIAAHRKLLQERELLHAPKLP